MRKLLLLSAFVAIAAMPALAQAGSEAVPPRCTAAQLKLSHGEVDAAMGGARGET